jgi:hypothetical protein
MTAAAALNNLSEQVRNTGETDASIPCHALNTDRW